MLNIKEIALKIANEYDKREIYFPYRDDLANFAEALIAELAKQNEPVARLLHRKTKSLQESCRTVARTYEECKKDAYPDDWKEGKPLYTFPPTAEQIANETAWQPIETAPKDGSWVLGWRQYATRPRLIQFDTDYEEWANEDGEHVYSTTHWMPLPKAPVNTANS